MLLKIHAPDIHRESELIHETMQRVLVCITKTERFQHISFSGTSRVHKRYTGNRSDSHINKYIDACCKALHNEKRTFQLSHKADRKFIKKDSGFRFSIHRNKQVPTYIKELMVETYYNVFADRGFRFKDIKPEVINRLWFINKIKEVNKQLQCCPYCGEALKFPRDRNSGNVTLDHFFPESKYPTLSVALWNLIPVCSDCNSKYKQALDPLENQNGVAEIQNLCLPYEDPLADDLELVFQCDATGTGSDGVTVKAKPGVPALIQKKIANYVRFTKLNNKWSFELTKIREMLVVMLPAMIRRYNWTGPADIINYMNEQSQPEHVREEMNYEPYKLLTAAYYQWLVNQPHRIQEFWDACK